MKAKAEEDTRGDAVGTPGPDSDGSTSATAKSSARAAQVAAKTPPDKDEVQQCLEYIVSVCIGDAGADGDGGGVAGLDAEEMAVEKEADASETETEETAANAPEALLPGFELSAKERKKVSCRCDERGNNVDQGMHLRVECTRAR